MAGKTGTIETLARQLGIILQPLQDRLSSGNVIQLFAELGLQFPPQLLQPGFVSALNTCATAASALPDLITQLTTSIDNGDESGILQASAKLIEQTGTIISTFEQIGQQLNSIAGSLPGMTATEVTTFAQNLPSSLLSYLLISYLEHIQPSVVGIANLLGILDYIPNPGVQDDPTHPPYISRQLQLGRLGKIFASPADLLHTLYNWGDPSFDGTLLIPRLSTTLSLLGIPSHVTTPGPGSAMDSTFFAVQTNPASNPPGLLATLKYPILGGIDLTLPLGGIWSVRLQAQGEFIASLQATIIPLDTLSLKPPSGTLAGQLTMDIIAQGPDADHPIVLLGQTGGSVLQTNSFTFGTGLNLTWDSSSGSAAADLIIHIDVAGGKAVIDLSEGDGFIAALLSGVNFAANLDFKMLWSPSTGFQIVGSSAIEIAIPTHLTLGPLDIEKLYLKLGLGSDGSLPAEISAAFQASLGPLQASVDRIGLNITTTFPAHGGNLGPANLALSFKPPSGVGLSVNAGIVQGGGFLYIDTDRGEYAGALELVFADFLSLHAIGLITTKMPDGSSGFSLLVIITAEFGAGIQLGFGFTLLGVGGLLGLNRIMLLQPLLDGVRTGSINSIMFPQNVVANAPRIISDLRAIFPPQLGIFLIGPMAKLGWGEPTLVSLALGVIIEIPGDIAILGVLKLALPADDVAVIVIQVNFAGAIEFDKKRMYFFASLFDSRVLFITIEGEMGVLFGFGDNANFVISVGGFHPQYTPPPLPFPNPRRIEIDILNESYARIRCDGYFSVTSDTVQFGAHVDMFFGFSAVSVSGHIGFDALIQFSPFHFVVSFSASFSVQVFGMGVFGIDIEAQLSGPTPWNVHGKASLSFLFFSIGVNIDVTWGDSRNTLLPPIAVMPLLSTEFSKQSNWRAVLPGNSHLLVTLRKLGEAEAAFLLHPAGTLHISQRAVPLDLTLDKVGNQKPNDANRFALTVASAGLAKTAELQEQFAPSQFQNFDDATKLSQPGYEPMDSGIELSAAGTSLASGTAITRVVRYDLTVIDTKYRRYAKRFFSQAGALFNHFLGGASVTKCPLSAYRAAQMQPVSVKVAVGPETFAVALRSNNTGFSAEAVAFTSQAAAHDYLNSVVASNPSLAGTLHVLPQFEVAA